MRLLWDESDLTAKQIDIEIFNLLSIDINVSGSPVIKPGDQLDQGAFARSGASNKGNGFPTSGRKRDIL